MSVGVPAVFDSVIEVLRVTAVVEVAVSVTAGPDGGVPLTVALLTTVPASTSAWVRLWVALQVVEALGATVVSAQLSPVT